MTASSESESEDENPKAKPVPVPIINEVAEEQMNQVDSSSGEKQQPTGQVQVTGEESQVEDADGTPMVVESGSHAGGSAP